MIRYLVFLALCLPALAQDVPRLEGTLISGDLKVAVFSFMENGKKRTVRARVNEQVGTYQVTAIERNRVMLSREGRIRVVPVFSGKRSGPVAKPAGTISRPPPSLPNNRAPQRGNITPKMRPPKIVDSNDESENDERDEGLPEDLQEGDQDEEQESDPDEEPPNDEDEDTTPLPGFILSLGPPPRDDSDS